MIAAFDTCGAWVCAAVGDPRGLRAQVRRAARLNHNEVLPDLFGALAVDASIESIAVNQGPGTFTGTRVGVAFAAGLAQAIGVRVLPISSFVVAASLAPQGAQRVRVALPLVREVWGVGVMVRERESWHEESCDEITEQELHTLDPFDALISPWASWPRAIEPPSDWNPAVTVLNLAHASSSDDFVSPAELTVRYLGKCQAERVFEAKHGR